MGIHNRDYIRETPPPAGFASGGDVWKRLIIATAVVFVLQMVFTRPPTRADLRDAMKSRGLVQEFDALPEWQVDEHLQIFQKKLTGGKLSILTEWLELDSYKVMHQGQIWRLVTYAFCHARGDLLHIIFNMLILLFFGKTLETMYGSREFLFFYLSAAFVAGVVYLGVGLAVGRMGSVVGASGSTMALLMLFAMCYPRQRVFLMGVIPIEIRWLVAGLIIWDLYPVIGELAGADASSDGVAHSAHLGGLAFGFLYKKFNLRLAGFFGRLKMPRVSRLAGARRKIKIFQPEPEERRGSLEQEVDAILAKIHKQGEASLTDQERKTLKNASRRYKNR